MKYTYLLLIPLFFISCKEEAHYHDGFYKANIIDFNNIYNSHKETIKVTGNSIILSKYSFDGVFLGETVISCKQYPDKIEFQDNGFTKVLRYQDSDTSLMLNELAVFKYIGKEGDIIVTKAKSKPLIKNNNNGTITLLPDEKINPVKFVPPDIKENEEEIPIGVYASETGWFNVYQKGNNYTIKKPGIDENDEEICTGTLRKDGRIIDSAGNETSFKFKKNILYQMVNGIWIKYDDQTCGM